MSFKILMIDILFLLIINILNSMLESHQNVPVATKIKNFISEKPNLQSQVQDLILSLNHRLSNVENMLISKIDRPQCMMILQAKTSLSHFKKLSQQINTKIQRNQKIIQQKIEEQQKQNIQSLEKLKQKLKGKNKQQKKANQNHKIELKSQQLHLQSNQTMFSIVVDQIAALKQAQGMYEKRIEQRQRININLNNEVCQKIQNLQKQILNNIQFIKQTKLPIKPQPFQQSSNQWFHYDQKSEKQDKQYKLRNSKTNKLQSPQPIKASSLDAHKLSHIMRSIESLQKDMSNKINIKDILPIIKKNLTPLSQLIQEVKFYTEQAINSTKKILQNQSEINQQLCTVSKIAWWQSFEQANGFALWNKEIANLVPQNYVTQKKSNQILIVQQGSYIIKILSPCQEITDFILIGGNEVEIVGESLIKIQKNTPIQVPSAGGQLFLSIQKV